MKFYCKNTINGLIPLYPADFDEKRKLKIGKDYEVTIKNPRNIYFHRKFFALMNLAHEQTSLEMPFDTYRRYVITKAGYFNAYSTPRGTFFEPQSISFANMSQEIFEELYSRCIDIIIKDIGATSEEIEQQLIGFF